MRVVYLAAGAAGMFCGSCIRDNRLAASLLARGRDIKLVPLYTPTRTDEPDVSEQHVYYGGINVFLQQKSDWFGRTPGFLHNLLDSPRLLRGVGRFAARTKPADLGALAVSVMQGPEGRQRRELDLLIDGLRQIAPDVINLPNLMFIGIAAALREALRVPVLMTLGGEDVFLDRLPEPFRGEALALIAQHAANVDAYVALTEYYARHCEAHFGLPHDRMHIVPMGIAMDEAARETEPPVPPFNIGFVARVCPDKGFDVLCRAYIDLRRRGRDCRLITGGYLGGEHADWLAQMRGEINAAGFGQGFEYRGELSRENKLALLRELHVFSMPSAFPEAKGLPVLEALGAGVPVVQPRRGSFPELLQQTGGGILYDGDEPDALADAIETLIDAPSLRRSLATAGSAAVREKFDHNLMADRAWTLYEKTASNGI